MSISSLENEHVKGRFPLNQEQQEAVEALDPALLILAGAGSGKTRVLTEKVSHLIRNHGIEPHKITAVTFTNKAANEMKDRIKKATDDIVDLSLRDSCVNACTFHSFGLDFLIRNHKLLSQIGYKDGFMILDRDEQIGIVKRIMKQAQSDGAVDLSDEIKPGDIIDEISSAKSKWKPSGQEMFIGDPDFFEIAQRYQKFLLQENKMDFDDLLINPLRLLLSNPALTKKEQNRIDWFMVDEYQDVNDPQYMLLKTLSAKDTNIMVVGDPDQSIYGWRGANINMIMKFEEDFKHKAPRVIKLEQNYRSTKNILSGSNQLIAINKTRYEKDLWTNKTDGNKVSCVYADNAYNEADWIVNKINSLVYDEGYQHKDIVILYRVNSLTHTYEKKLFDNGIPYEVIKGTAFYERKEVKDILAYLRLILYPDDMHSFIRAVMNPGRGIAQTGAETLFNTISNISQLNDMTGSNYWDKLKSLAYSGNFKKNGAGLANLCNTMCEICKHQDNIPKAIEIILDDGFREHLKKMYDKKKDTGEKEWEIRVENIMQLSASIDTSKDLYSILAEMALYTDADTSTTDLERASHGVKLMTLHSAKGLEFPVVFMVAMEDQTFPHSRANQEEERRLCYVGMTRAEEKLFMTAASERKEAFSGKGGRMKESKPSMFFSELPRDEVEWEIVARDKQKKVELERKLGIYKFKNTPNMDRLRELSNSIPF